MDVSPLMLYVLFLFMSMSLLQLFFLSFLLFFVVICLFVFLFLNAVAADHNLAAGFCDMQTINRWPLYISIMYTYMYLYMH